MYLFFGICIIVDAWYEEVPRWGFPCCDPPTQRISRWHAVLLVIIIIIVIIIMPAITLTSTRLVLSLGKTTSQSPQNANFRISRVSIITITIILIKNQIKLDYWNHRWCQWLQWFQWFLKSLISQKPQVKRPGLSPFWASAACLECVGWIIQLGLHWFARDRKYFLGNVGVQK